MFHRLSLGIAPKDSYDTRSPGRFDIRTAAIDFKSIFFSAGDGNRGLPPSGESISRIGDDAESGLIVDSATGFIHELRPDFLARCHGFPPRRDRFGGFRAQDPVEWTGQTDTGEKCDLTCMNDVPFHRRCFHLETEGSVTVC